MPHIFEFTTHTMYVNSTSRLSFEGSKDTTGMAMYFRETEVTHELQANPGTLVPVPGDSDGRVTGEVTVPTGSFAKGKNTARIWGMAGGVREREGWEAKFNSREAVVLPTTAKSFKFSSTRLSKDEPITCTWVASPQQARYQIKYKLQNGEEVALAGIDSTTQSHTFPTNTLPLGKITVSVAINDGVFWSNRPETDITTYAFEVVSLEPNGVAQNKDKAITATWGGNDPYTKYEFEYSCNKGTKMVTGTTGNSYSFPANFFDVETVKLKVRLYNKYVWSEWKTVNFITFGKPDTPALTTKSEYTSATPTFTWTSIGQVSYRLQIYKSDTLVLDSGDVYSSVKEHTFTTALENKVVYTAKLRIKNQYEYSSDWDTKAFKIVFVELQKPRFDLFSDDRLGKVMFNIYNATGQLDFKHCELLRREYNEAGWVKIATNLSLNSTYTDYTCRSGVLYEYKVSAISTSGGYTDSDTVLKEVSLKNTMLSDTADHNNYVALIHNPKKSRNVSRETHAMQYSGLRAPSFEFGDIRYVSMNTSFTVDEIALDKLLDLYYSNNVLLLRDNRGKKIYGHVSGEINIEDADFMKYRVGFVFVETNFNEGV